MPPPYPGGYPSAGAPPPSEPPPYPGGYPSAGAPPPPGYPPPSGGAAPGYPPPPGYPGGTNYPGAGYPGGAAAYPGGPAAPGDPIVPPPQGDFGAWWSHLWAAFGRHWKPLLVIALLTYSLPSVIYSAISGPFQNRVFRTDTTDNTYSFHWSASMGFFLAALIFWIVSAFIAAIGFGAATRYLTRRAAGQPESLGDALRYGVSRSGRLAPLFILAALMTLVGLVFCILPGIYLGLATSMVGPIALYETGGTAAIGRSFRMVNRNFGAVLGRFAALIALLIVLGLVAACIGGILSGGGTAGYIWTGIVIAVLEAPLVALLFLGTLLTYTQLRGREVPTDAPSLSAALDGQPVGVMRPTW